MPRIRNKKTPVKETKESNWFLYVIIFILVIQTAFLLYKNYGYISENISSNETEFISENNGTDVQDDKVKHNGDYSDLSRPVRVSILNGCGKSGLAGKWKAKLRKFKYDIRETGNADKNYINSIVLSRIKNMKPAFDLAKKLGIPDKDVLLQINKDIVDIGFSYLGQRL